MGLWDNRTIALVDVERGDRIQVIGHNRSYLVIGLDRIANQVTLEIEPIILSDSFVSFGVSRTFSASDVIGHLREYKPKCYRLLWSKNIGLIKD
jgi:hypothetical protein